jgi:hypothetical protein
MLRRAHQRLTPPLDEEPTRVQSREDRCGYARGHGHRELLCHVTRACLFTGPSTDPRLPYLPLGGCQRNSLMF